MWPTRSIDAFLESLAQDRRKQAIGVILSGTASDGTLGLEAIKAEDGITFAQDESAKYDSMPRSAVAAGCVDFVLTPEKIGKELVRIAKHPFVSGASRSPIFPTSPEDALLSIGSAYNHLESSARSGYLVSCHRSRGRTQGIWLLADATRETPGKINVGPRPDRLVVS